MKLFVKNIDRDINEVALESLFAVHGKVISTKIIYDKITWESKGFGFIEMLKKEEGEKAIAALNGFVVKGRPLIVTEADETKRRF
jgi:RNA recognition motif-containing protein